MKSIVNTSIFVITLVIGSYSCKNIVNRAIQNELSYTNPIIHQYLADPYMKYENGYFYLFATGEASDGRFIPIYRSKDLTNWGFIRGAVENGSKTDWNYKHFWAPEVIKIKGKYYLYYTASPEDSPSNSGNRVGLAIADSIQGPYINYGIVIPNASLDGHPYFDKDSTMYIFYTIEWQNAKGLKAGNIYVDKMLTPTRVEDKPTLLIASHDWQEGPFIYPDDSCYYLTFSCGNWRDSTYRLQYAISKTITGPYTEIPDTILKSNLMVKGPGHHSFFDDAFGRKWIVYHGWDAAYTARYPRIDRVYMKAGRIFINGPTYSKQIVNE
jgi:beta-xylosidase